MAQAQTAHAPAAHAHATAEIVRDPAFVPPQPLMPMIERLAARRSAPLRSLGGPAPSPEERDLLFALALRVPDHGRLTPWRFIVVEGGDRQALGARLDALYARQNPDLPAAKADMWTLYLMRAPLTVVLVSRPDPAAKVPEWNQMLSAGAAGMALTVAASALGFASQWLLKWPGRDPQAAALLGVEGGERVAGFIHIGRPTLESPDRPRPEAARVVTRWRPEA